MALLGLWERHVGDSQFIYYTKKDKVDAERWFCNPVPDLDPVETQSTPMDLQTGQLPLRAKIVGLIVTTQHSRRWRQSPRCEEGIHGICELLIFDSDGVRAGVVTLDGNAFHYFTPGMQEFVCLSQTTLPHADSDPAWDEETESYAGEMGGPPIRPRSLLGVGNELSSLIKRVMI
jgi:hypothetical protein